MKRTLTSSLGPAGLFLSATDLWASSGEGAGWRLDVIWQIVAFVILVVFLVFALRKPLTAFLVKRREEIRNALEEAKRKEGEATRLLAEWEQKVEGMTREIENLHQSIRQEGEAERQRVVERSREEGERIKKQAQVIAEQEIKKARTSLKKEMVDLSLELAESLLKTSVQPQDQERLVKEYIGKMKEIR